MSPASVSAMQPLPPVSHAPAPAPNARQKVLIRNVDFYYGASQALKNINLALYDKNVTAFIGPSGCGKSTLLRVLNRIYELYPGQSATGEVLVDGENILAPGLDLNLLRAKIGMVFQKPTPFPMSIRDNIAFGIRLYEKLPQSELDERIEFGAPPRRSVGRGQGQAEAERAQPVGRPAAAAVHRPGDRGQAGDPAARRARLGT